MSDADISKSSNEDKKAFSDGEKPDWWVDYKTLPLVKSRVKFFDKERKFGFVTILNDDGSPEKDAYLSGRTLEKAGIYKVEEGTVLYIKYVEKEKGDAVVSVDRKKTMQEVTGASLKPKTNNSETHIEPDEESDLYK